MVARHTFAFPVTWALSSGSGLAVLTGTHVGCTDGVVTAAPPALPAQASVHVEAVEAHRLAATLYAHTLVHVLAHGVDPTADPSFSAETFEAWRMIDAMALATTHNTGAIEQWPSSAQSLGGGGGDHGGTSGECDRRRSRSPFK